MFWHTCPFRKSKERVRILHVKIKRDYIFPLRAGSLEGENSAVAYSMLLPPRNVIIFSRNLLKRVVPVLIVNQLKEIHRSKKWVGGNSACATPVEVQS